MTVSPRWFRTVFSVRTKPAVPLAFLPHFRHLDLNLDGIPGKDWPLDFHLQTEECQAGFLRRRIQHQPFRNGENKRAGTHLATNGRMVAAVFGIGEQYLYHAREADEPADVPRW